MFLRIVDQSGISVPSCSCLQAVLHNESLGASSNLGLFRNGVWLSIDEFFSDWPICHAWIMARSDPHHVSSSFYGDRMDALAGSTVAVPFG